jgi:hypothetical protein
MKLRTGRKTPMLSIAVQTAVGLCLFVIMAPTNSFASGTGGSYFTFSPDSVNLEAVIGTETDTQDVEITNVSGKAIEISGITIEIDSSEFSETNNCPAEILAGQSCAMKVSFRPESGGGRDDIKKAIIVFEVANTEVAYLDVQGHAI